MFDKTGRAFQVIKTNQTAGTLFQGVVIVRLNCPIRVLNMPRPLVGIIGNSYVIDDSYPVQATGVHNIEAVGNVADVMAVSVPSIPSVSNVNELCERFHGFVFTGARPNVHPHEYGEKPTDAHGQFDTDRDKLALPLIRTCVERGIPVLGICRGFQEFNVAFGGTLYPEIRDLPGRMNHRMPPEGTLEEKFALRHEVALTEGSLAREIFADTAVMTNSLHGQGINQPGPRVVIEGFAPDETQEVLRIDGASGFAFAVQWHPEYRADEDQTSRRLFTSFGDAVRSYANGN